MEQKQEQEPTQYRAPRYEAKLKLDSYSQMANSEEIQKSLTKLENKYTIWVLMQRNKMMLEKMGKSAEAYESVIKPINTFQTVEDFFACYTHMKKPALYPQGTYIHIFVDGVKPMWEDEQCKDGGRWVIKIPKNHTNKIWEELIYCMLGEQFGPEKEVLGLVLGIKQNFDIVSVWNKTSSDKEKVEQIKQDIQKHLENEPLISLEYEIFQELLNAPKDKPDYSQKYQSRGGYVRGGRGRGRGGHRGGFNPNNQQNKTEGSSDTFERNPVLSRAQMKNSNKNQEVDDL